MLETVTDSETCDFVIFRLEDEYFAFDVAEVAEVLPYSEPARLPRAPKFLAGIIDVRGHLLPVIDLRLRAEVGVSETPRHILAVRLGDRFLGAMADEVLEVYAAEASAIVGTVAVADKLDLQFVRRALRWGRRLVPVMDAARLLTTTETLRLKRVRAPRRRGGESG